MMPLTRLERFAQTRTGRVMLHPAFVIGMVLFMIANAGVTGWALTTAWDAKSREIQVARTEAAHAVARANEANRNALASRAAAGESARKAFCGIVGIGASDNPPPTTPRAFTQQQYYKQLGQSPLLHCFPKP